MIAQLITLFLIFSFRFARARTAHENARDAQASIAEKGLASNVSQGAEGQLFCRNLTYSTPTVILNSVNLQYTPKVLPARARMSFTPKHEDKPQAPTTPSFKPPTSSIVPRKLPAFHAPAGVNESILPSSVGPVESTRIEADLNATGLFIYRFFFKLFIFKFYSLGAPAASARASSVGRAAVADRQTTQHASRHHE